MIVDFSSDKGLRLIDQDQFRSFKLVTDTAPSSMPVIEGLRFEHDNAAWVTKALVVSLLTSPAPAQWEESFDAMVLKAKAYGWVNDQGEVRAHVERIQA